MHKCNVAFMGLAAISMVSACSDNGSQSEPVASDVTKQASSNAPDSPPAFLSKDMDWVPKDIWLPVDFKPTQSQKISPVAETYVLRGETDMNAAELETSFSEHMVAAGYEPFGSDKPKPGKPMFRGNGHGMIVVTITDKGPMRELTVGVENASGT
ncbi:MAG: hypothetical protein V7676_07390 [Parasphingorhabdus sp.]|uniref:hypothetical protein n=1 Tax=Parasphingorhabdus sp. TaxID=2709688 RepID=UPI0030015647